MALRDRLRRWRQPRGWVPPVNEALDYNGGWNATSMPQSLEPKLDESKTRVYDDELDPDWRDPITEPDPDEAD